MGQKSERGRRRSPVVWRFSDRGRHRASLRLFDSDAARMGDFWIDEQLFIQTSASSDQYLLTSESK